MKTIIYTILTVYAVHCCGTLRAQHTLRLPASAQLPGSSMLSATAQELKLYKQLFKPRLTIAALSLQSDMTWNRGLISNDYFTATSLLQYNIKTALGAEIAGIPLQAEYTRRESTPGFTDWPQKNWYKVSFNAEAYKAKLQQLAQKLGPEALTRSGAQLKALKQNLAQQLTSTYKNKANNLLQAQLDSISGTVNLMDLAGKSPAELKTLLFGQDLEGLKADLERKLRETMESQLDAAKKDSLVTAMQDKLDALETKLEYLEKISSILQKAQSSGLLGAMKDLDGKAAEEYQALLANPTALAKKLGEKFNFNGIEKIISLLSQFRLGGQSLPFTDNLNMPLLTRGLSFDININDKLLGFSVGKILPVINNISLPGYPASPGQDSAAEKPFYWSLHFRKGPADGNHKGIKITSITTKGANNVQYGPTDLGKKNTRLIHLYSRERIAGNNWLQLELAKSITSSPDRNTRNFNGSREKMWEDLFSLNNLSIKIKAEGTIEQAGISHQLFFTKNIGTPFPVTANYFSTGGYETGFMFRMKQKQKKLSAYIRGNIRSYNTPGIAGSKWSNADVRARFSYRLKKGQQLQLSPFWHNGYKRYFLTGAPLTVKQQSKGLSADVNINRRIFGLYTTSMISVGVQQDIFPLVAATPGKTQAVSNSYNLMLNQAFLYGSHLLQLNAYYTKVTQDMDMFLYNTRLDLDAGGVFRINRQVTAGFALVYGYFKGAYTNIGIRPSVSGTILKKWVVDLNADIRKNITVVNPLFNQFTNLNCAFRYTIK